MCVRVSASFYVLNVLNILFFFGRLDSYGLTKGTLTLLSRICLVFQ